MKALVDRTLSDSKKELYDISQQFMLQSRFVTLFTKVIWAHPEAPVYVDVYAQSSFILGARTSIAVEQGL